MNNYQKYKNDAIYSMSPVELLILLYDECNKNFRKAKIALQEDDYTLFESTLGRNQKIIMYLIKTLDMEYPISRDLRRLYDYILFDIGRLFAGRKRLIDELDALQEVIQNLRDGFDGASKQVSDTHTIAENRVLG